MLLSLTKLDMADEPPGQQEYNSVCIGVSCMCLLPKKEELIQYWMEFSKKMTRHGFVRNTLHIGCCCREKGSSVDSSGTLTQISTGTSQRLPRPAASRHQRLPSPPVPMTLPPPLGLYSWPALDGHASTLASAPIT